MESVILLVRLFLFGIFALAGVGKFLDLKGSEKAFMEFGVPAGVALPASVALSIFEIVLAILFLSTATSWIAAIGALALLLLFIGQMTYQMAKGNAPDCHCFGQVHSEPVGKKSIARNIVFAGMTGLLVVSGRGAQGISLLDDRLDIIQLVLGLTVIGLLVAALSYLRQISRDQVKLMRQIEIMELVSREGGAVEREDAGHPHEGMPIGTFFPNFELPDLKGEMIGLSALREAKRPILFLFVSPNCMPCGALVPEFEQWQRDLAGKLNIVFISNGTAAQNFEKFAGEAEKVILLQKEREIAEAVKAQWTPTAILMDVNGRIKSHAIAGDGAIRGLIEQIGAKDLGDELTYFTNGHGHSHSKLGNEIPEFSLDDLNGKSITSNSFKGQNTLVTFWSPTCPHCMNMIADLKEWDKAKGAEDPNLVIFSDGDRAEHEALGIDSSIVLDKGSKVSVGLGMFGTPSAILVNETGRIISETAVGASEIWALVDRK